MIDKVRERERERPARSVWDDASLPLQLSASKFAFLSIRATLYLIPAIIGEEKISAVCRFNLGIKEQSI